MPRQNTFRTIKGRLRNVFHSHSSSISEKELKDLKELYNTKDNQETSDSADTSTIKDSTNTKSIAYTKDIYTTENSPDSVPSTSQQMSGIKSVAMLKTETNASLKTHMKSVCVDGVPLKDKEAV
jgi:hypothetical protein